MESNYEDLRTDNTERLVDHLSNGDVRFNIDKMKGLDCKAELNCKYVLFVDIMGMKTTMLRSFSRSTIFMGKMHSVLCELQKKHNNSISVYPVMDGAYIVAKEFSDIYNFIMELFVRIGKVFTVTKKPEECFLIRGALAYGPIVEGDTINEHVNRELAKEKEYKRRLLFGFPMILAYDGEKKAPPFGVYLDTTVRVNRNSQLSGIWYRWCKDPTLKKAITESLSSYFVWAKRDSIELMYDEEKISSHEKMANQYWR